MMDNETWLIEVGDEIIDKKADSSYERLSLLEQSIYCLWVIDYAIRNSGDLSLIEDVYPPAIEELVEKSRSQGWVTLNKFMLGAGRETEFCKEYYLEFESICSELRAEYENT